MENEGHTLNSLMESDALVREQKVEKCLHYSCNSEVHA